MKLLLYRCDAGIAPAAPSGVATMSVNRACLLRNRIELIHRDQNGWRANADASNPFVEYLNMLAAPINLRYGLVRNQSKICIIASHNEAVRLLRECFVEQ